MADNTRGGSNDPDLPSIATDDVGGVAYQRVKLDVGASGLSVPVEGALPVSDNGGSLTVDGPLTDAQLRAAVVPISDGAGSLTVDGSVEVTGTLTAITNVVHVDDNASALTVDNAGTFAVQVSSALPAGTAAIGKLAANSGVDIGDVDVTSVSGNVTVIQGTAANLKVDASAVAVPITDNAGSVTVDAPVTTPVFVRLSDGAAALATLPVSLAAAPSTAVTNAGTFAVQTTSDTPGTAATNLGKAEDAVAADGDTGVAMLAVRADIPASLTSLTGDYHFVTTDSLGRQWVRSDALETLLLDEAELLKQVIVEMRINNLLLRTGLNVNDDPDDFRNDPTFSLVN